MRKWILLLTALILLVPAAVHAQNATALKSLNVSLWSEYDQPSMLVIYDLEVSDDTAVPATVDVQIPSGANITAVAYQSDGQLLLANYQNNPLEDGESITLFITERTNYRVEYYLPLEREGNTRSFTFQWTSNYDIGEFNIDVQIPADSTDVKTDPAIPFVQGQPSLSGGAMINNLSAGQTYTLKLSYSRTSDAVMASSSAAQVEPVTPVDENTDGRSTLNNLPILLASFGVVLILIAGFFFFRSQTTSRVNNKPRRRSQRAPEATSQIYCHECGARAHEGDRFCRTCGSKLRFN